MFTSTFLCKLQTRKHYVNPIYNTRLCNQFLILTIAAREVLMRLLSIFARLNCVHLIIHTIATGPCMCGFRAQYNSPTTDLTARLSNLEIVIHGSLLDMTLSPSIGNNVYIRIKDTFCYFLYVSVNTSTYYIYILYIYIYIYVGVRMCMCVHCGT